MGSRVSQWVSQCQWVSDSFRFGDSYRISELCKLVLFALFYIDLICVFLFAFFYWPDLCSSLPSPSSPCWLSSHSWHGSLTSSQKNVVNIYTWGKDNFLLLISRKVSQLPPQLWQVRDNNKFSLQSLGTGVGRVCTGFLRTTLEYFKHFFAHTNFAFEHHWKIFWQFCGPFFPILQKVALKQPAETMIDWAAWKRVWRVLAFRGPAEDSGNPEIQSPRLIGCTLYTTNRAHRWTIKTTFSYVHSQRLGSVSSQEFQGWSGSCFNMFTRSFPRVCVCDYKCLNCVFSGHNLGLNTEYISGSETSFASNLFLKHKI